MAFATLALLVLTSANFPSDGEVWEEAWITLSLLVLAVALFFPPIVQNAETQVGPLLLATVWHYFGPDAVVNEIWFLNRWVVTSQYGEITFSEDSLCGVVSEQDGFRRALLMCAEMWGNGVIVNGDAAFLGVCSLHAGDMGVRIVPEIYNEYEVQGLSHAAGLGAALIAAVFWMAWGPDGKVHEWMVYGAVTVLGALVKQISFRIIERFARMEGRRQGLIYRPAVPSSHGDQEFYGEDDYRKRRTR